MNPRCALSLCMLFAVSAAISGALGIDGRISFPSTSENQAFRVYTLSSSSTSAAASTRGWSAGTASAQAKPAYAGSVAKLAISPSALPAGYPKPASLARRALRFEIIAVGAFPIMLFYTDIGFGIGRYIGSGFDSRYAPWPFIDSSSILPDDSERLLRIGVAVGISCAIAVFDLVASLRAEAAARASAELDSVSIPK